jgi:hypothetical protein
MTLNELIGILSANPKTAIQMTLPNQSFIPHHFHVTEIGRVQKDFIDCGGTGRQSCSCVLQIWVANDVSHRLDSDKLASIITKGSELFETTAIPVEVEYDNGLISQYPVELAVVTSAGITLHLGTKHAACLAPDRCGVQLDALPSCSTPGCC